MAELSFEAKIRMKGVILVFKNYGNHSILVLSFQNPTAITAGSSGSAPQSSIPEHLPLTDNCPYGWGHFDWTLQICFVRVSVSQKS